MSEDHALGRPPPLGFVYSPDYSSPHLLSYPLNAGVLYPHEVKGIKEWNRFRWVSASSSDCQVEGALLVGQDQDGSAIYAGRAYHQGDILPAKVIPSKQIAYVAYNGEEIIKDQFEVMVQNYLRWVWYSNGNVPDNAVIIGNTADGEPLYMGRVTNEGATTPGKIHRSHGVCYYPFNGEEKSSSDYEVLVLQ